MNNTEEDSISDFVNRICVEIVFLCVQVYD